LEVWVGDYVSDGIGGQRESMVAIFTLDRTTMERYTEISFPDKSGFLKKPRFLKKLQEKQPETPTAETPQDTPAVTQ